MANEGIARNRIQRANHRHCGKERDVWHLGSGTLCVRRNRQPRVISNWTPPWMKRCF